MITRDKYYTEIKLAVKSVSGKPTVDSLNQESLAYMLQMADLYVHNQLDKEIFFKELKKKYKKTDNYIEGEKNTSQLLRNLQYNEQYDEILISLNGHTDTLLSALDKPFVYIGPSVRTIPRVSKLPLDSYSSVMTKQTQDSDGNGLTTNLQLTVKRSQYIDVSNWEWEIFKRMAGILILAIALIITVILLFYLIFRALIRQKKIADMKADFANNITHELKTPLSSMGLILKTLKMKEILADQGKLTELFGMIERQHAKIQRTVDSVLESSMYAEITPELEVYNIKEYLINYTKNLDFVSSRLEVNIEEKDCSVLLNPGLIEKALNNLIDNAVKYTEIGTEIRLKAYLEGRNYCIDITDKGSGIDAQYIRYIFDKFYRIPEKNEHTIKGLGLGLYLSKHAIELMKGKLLVRNNQGSGCTFTIILPLYYH